MKLLWGPIIDRYPPPLFASLGQRRGWAVFSFTACMLCFLCVGWLGVETSNSLYLSIACIVLASVFSGCIYMIGLAYEIESLDNDQYAAGSASFIIGYRLGLFVAGAGSLYIAYFANWTIAYMLVSFCMFIGILTVLFRPEPHRAPKLQPGLWQPTENSSRFSQLMHFMIRWLKESIFLPLKEFWSYRYWLPLFALIICYKLEDDLDHALLYAFYVDLGFSKLDMAQATKLFGMLATILGACIAGSLTPRLGLLKSLFLFKLVHTFSYFLYFLFSFVGKDLNMLYLTVGFEHLTSGMTRTALIAFLWSLCGPKRSASQYACLGSCLAFKHAFFALLGGWVADQVNWSLVFLISLAISIPGFLLLRSFIKGKYNLSYKESTEEVGAELSPISVMAS